MKQRTIKKLNDSEAAIDRLEKKGWKVWSLTPYQYRIADGFDIYPIGNRYHDVIKNKRGYFSFQNLEQILEDHGFKPSEQVGFIQKLKNLFA